MGRSAVDLGHQFAVGRPRRGEVLVPFGEFCADGLSADDAYCATKGPCSLIRALRAGVRPPVYRA